MIIMAVGIQGTVSRDRRSLCVEEVGEETMNGISRENYKSNKAPQGSSTEVCKRHRLSVVAGFAPICPSCLNDHPLYFLASPLTDHHG